MITLSLEPSTDESLVISCSFGVKNATDPASSTSSLGPLVMSGPWVTSFSLMKLVESGVLPN